ncbi:MAG: acetyl-CoA carboxylase biotin carboxylase subunit family protein [Victivallaceae bacterium]
MKAARKKLAIIGASNMQLPLVEKARAMNLETLVFAWPEGAVAAAAADRFFPLSTLDKEGILDVCRRENIDGIASIASDIAVPTVSFVAEALHLSANSCRSAYLSTHKFAMRQALSAGGVNCPRYALLRSGDDIAEATAALRYPLIVKPCDRSGSLAVSRVENEAELRTALPAALEASLCHQAIVEEFIEGIEISIEGISFGGDYHMLAVTDKTTTGAPHYVELAHHQPSKLPRAVLAEAARQVRPALTALEIRCGASHAELLITRDRKIYVTEIGARMGGDFIGSDLVGLSTGYDYLRGVIEVALGKFTLPKRGPGMAAGVYFYTAATPEVREWIVNAADHPEVVRAELTRPDLPAGLSVSADRSGYFIYRARHRLVLKPNQAGAIPGETRELSRHPAARTGRTLNKETTR